MAPPPPTAPPPSGRRVLSGTPFAHGIDVNALDGGGRSLPRLVIEQTNQTSRLRQLVDAGAEVGEAELELARADRRTQLVKWLEKRDYL